MKNIFKTLFLLGFILSCNIDQSDNKRSDEKRLNFSDSYKPPTFKNDTRKESILSIVDSLKPLFEKYIKDKNIPGAAYGIVVDNQLIHADAVGLINRSTERSAKTTSCFRIASMTKSFTAMAIVKLRDEKRLSLHDPASKYIPAMSKLTYLSKDASAITIQNLLTMTAGFPEDNPWGDRQLDEPDQMLIDLIAGGVAFSNVPSHKFEYSNTGYALLGNIISNVTGMPYQDYIKNSMLNPLGMTDTYWEYADIPEDQLVQGYRWEDDNWKEEPFLHDGSYGAMGGLITSIEDFAKYVSLHLSAWPPRSDDENGPIRRSSLREMQTPQFSRMYAKAKNKDGDNCPVQVGYGYGLGIYNNCDGFTWISHGGALPGFGSNYRFYPEYGIGIMAFCNLTYTSPWPVDEIEKLIVDASALQPRILPVSSILKKRQEQVAEMIQHWDQELEPDILAENFYMDKSRDHRIAEIKELLKKAGKIHQIEEIKPSNQLRGTFKIEAENGVINVHFTLSPEKDPKVQQLNVWMEE